MLLDDKARWQDRLPLLDLGDQGCRFGMDFGELEFCYLLELLLGGLNLTRIKSGDLHQDPAGALRGDHGLTDPELVNTLADDFDRLLKHVGRDRLIVLRDQLQEEGSTAAQIEAEMNLLRGRRRRIEAEE